MTQFISATFISPLACLLRLTINMGDKQMRPVRTKQRKLKIFQLVQRQLAILGIVPELEMQAYRLNARVLMVFFIFGSSSACILEYTFCEAKSLSEYTESSYMGSYVLTIMFAFLIFILKLREIFMLITDCESVINTSKSEMCKSMLKNLDILLWKIARFQHWSSPHPRRFFVEQIDWPNKSMKSSSLPLLCSRRLAPLCHGSHTRISFISRPIWGQMRLNCPFQCGKPMKPMSTASRNVAALNIFLRPFSGFRSKCKVHWNFWLPAPSSLECSHIPFGLAHVLLF